MIFVIIQVSTSHLYFNYNILTNLLQVVFLQAHFSIDYLRNLLWARIGSNHKSALKKKKINANLAACTYRDKKDSYQFMLKDDAVFPELTSTGSNPSSFPKETPAENH